jgi:hypothetical protein
MSAPLSISSPSSTIITTISHCPQVWQPLGAHQRFADVVAVLREAMAFFETAVQSAKLRDPSIGAVMQVAIRGGGGQMHGCRCEIFLQYF